MMNHLMSPFKEKLKQYSIILVQLSLARLEERHGNDLGLEPLSDRKWSRKLILFHKIVNGFCPFYLQEILSSHNESFYQTRSKSVNNTKQFRARTNTFESSYFPYCTKEWFKLSSYWLRVANLNVKT